MGMRNLRSLFQQISPVVFEFSVCRCVPDFHRLSHLQQVIDMPMRIGSGLEMVAEASTQSAGTEGTSNVSVIAGDDVETAQATDLDPLHLRHRRNQDVGAFLLREVHSDQPKVLPFQPQLPASTSVKFR